MKTTKNSKEFQDRLDRTAASGLIREIMKQDTRLSLTEATKQGVELYKQGVRSLFN